MRLVAVPPIVGPVVPPGVGPALRPEALPAIPPAIGQTAGPVVPPAIGPAARPVARPAPPPAARRGVRPTIGPATRPAPPPVAGPVAPPATRPRAGPAVLPVARPATPPAAGAATGPATPPAVAPAPLRRPPKPDLPTALPVALRSRPGLTRASFPAVTSACLTESQFHGINRNWHASMPARPIAQEGVIEPCRPYTGRHRDPGPRLRPDALAGNHRLLPVWWRCTCTSGTRPGVSAWRWSR